MAVPTNVPALKVALGKAILEGRPGYDPARTPDSTHIQATNQWLSQHHGALGPIAQAASRAIAAGPEQARAHFREALRQQEPADILRRIRPSYFFAVIHLAISTASAKDLMDFLYALRDLDR